MAPKDPCMPKINLHMKPMDIWDMNRTKTSRCVMVSNAEFLENESDTQFTIEHDCRFEFEKLHQDASWYEVLTSLAATSRWTARPVSCVCVLQYVAVCCSALQCVAVYCRVLQCVAGCCSVLQCVAVCCSVLQCGAVCCSVLQCVAVCCSVLQCVAVCCSVLPCVAV